MRAASRGRTRARRRHRDDATARLSHLTLHALPPTRGDVDVRGKRVFIRSDLNVPQDDAGNITDDTRIRASVPGIRDASARGAAVMVTSHLGRPTEGAVDEAGFARAGRAAPVRAARRAVPLVRDWVDGGAWHAALKPGDVVLLENCRFNTGEKKDDDALARKMAALCDVYVNDAFGTAHRAEATTHGIARYAPIACAGPLLAAELDALGKALANPARPLVAIVARLEGLDQAHDAEGARRQGRRADRRRRHRQHVHPAAAGGQVGKSLVETDLRRRGAGDPAMRSRRKVPIPIDAVVRARSSRRRAAPTLKAIENVGAGRHDPRHRPDDRRGARRLIVAKAGTIVWNGPVGVFEFDAFAGGTEALAEAIAASPAFSIAGGGDTLAAIAQVRHRRTHLVHLDRRRRVPRVPRGQDAARGGDPRNPRGRLDSGNADARPVRSGASRQADAHTLRAR